VSGALLSNEACALLLGLKPQSLRIRRMRGNGGPPFIRLGGPSSRAFYREEDVTRWLAERPSYTSTSAERAALHAAAKASAPPKTRKRLANQQAKTAAPLADSTTRRRPRPAPRRARKKS
jgi:hypothetical protein